MHTLPLIPSVAHYGFDTTIDDVAYRFDVRWNEIDAAWYLDLYDVQGTSIEQNMKVVVGTYLGRTSNHALFQDGVIAVIDTSGAYADAGFDDLGTRVQVRYFSIEDIVQKMFAN